MEPALNPLDLQLLCDVCLTWSGDEKDCGYDQLRDRVRPPTSHGTSQVHNPTKPLSRLKQHLEYTCHFAFLSIIIALRERYHRMRPPVIVSVISQGCRRFETFVFFSVKINISTTGGFRVGFFQPDTNHP